jgi:hypothetical protein
LLIFVFVVESAVPALPVSNPDFGDFGRAALSNYSNAKIILFF